MVDAVRPSTIHTPLVMGLALVPAFGGAAYLVSGEYTGIDPWVCKQAEITKNIACKS